MLGSIGDWGGMEKPSKLPSFGGKIKRGRRKGRGAGLDGGPARLRPEPRMDVRPPAGREGRRRSIVRIKVTWTLEDGATRLSEFCRVLLCVRVWYRVRLQTQENQEVFEWKLFIWRCYFRPQILCICDDKCKKNV